ncbi:MAG TPA: sugar kinase, partial [Beijerinckiaceae bacterium]|nr:sugar kinase [Beijerinckiaceae bacterium]
MRAASIGECMIELSEMPDGRFSRAYGGDTLNTAIYMARLGVEVDYVTALGDDQWSDEMLAGWRNEGVGTERVVRLPGRVPGLYIIQTDRSGERRFHYWRDSAPARDLFNVGETPAVVEALSRYELIFFSGITLSLYGEAGRAAFFAAIERARARGASIAFDTNFRPRGWPDRGIAKAAFQEALERSDIVLASTEDLTLLFGAGSDLTRMTRPATELVIKQVEPACRVMAADGTDQMVAAKPVARVVDTTAAGDSFAAAYLASRFGGAGPVAAAEAGHALAGVVVGYPGAIIPRSAMPAALCS